MMLEVTLEKLEHGLLFGPRGGGSSGTESQKQENAARMRIRSRRLH